MKRTAKSDEPIVVTVRPWEHRREKKETPDPLVAIDAKPPEPLSREDIYE